MTKEKLKRGVEIQFTDPVVAKRFFRDMKKAGFETVKIRRLR
jgi:hypothetical protein